jgi:hypothetical protein
LIRFFIFLLCFFCHFQETFATILVQFLKCRKHLPMACLYVTSFIFPAFYWGAAGSPLEKTIQYILRHSFPSREVSSIDDGDGTHQHDQTLNSGRAVSRNTPESLYEKLLLREFCLLSRWTFKQLKEHSWNKQLTEGRWLIKDFVDLLLSNQPLTEEVPLFSSCLEIICGFNGAEFAYGTVISNILYPMLVSSSTNPVLLPVLIHLIGTIGNVSFRYDSSGGDSAKVIRSLLVRFILPVPSSTNDPLQARFWPLSVRVAATKVLWALSPPQINLKEESLLFEIQSSDPLNVVCSQQLKRFRPEAISMMM